MTPRERIEAGLASLVKRVDSVPEWNCTNSARGEGWGSRGDCPLCGKYTFEGTEDVTEQAHWDHLEEAHDRAQTLRTVAALRKVLALHVEVKTSAEPVCAICVDQDPAEDESPWPEIYPCPTITELAEMFPDG